MITIGRIENVETSFIPLKWANGRVESDASSNGKRFTSHIGFYVECDTNHELDEAMEKAGFKRMRVQHGNGVVTQQWNMGEELTLLPVTQGPPAKTTSMCLNPRNRQRTTDAGLGLEWHGDKPNFGVVVYIEALTKVGCYIPLKFTAKSRMVGYVLEALISHLNTAKYADSIVDREKHPAPVQLFEIGWKVQAGEQTTFANKSGESATVTVMVSAHPPVNQLSREYIAGIYVRDNDDKQALYDAVERDWPLICEWAKMVAERGMTAEDDDYAAEERNGKATSNGSADGMGGRKTIEGLIIAEKYRSEKLAVFEVNTDDGNWQVKLFKDNVEKSKSISEGDVVQFVGSWKIDEQYGPAFNANKFEVAYVAEGASTMSSDDIPF